MDLITGILSTAFLAGGVLALAALGEVLAERVGVVNLGVEGLMALGAITGIATVVAYPSPTLGFLAALGVGFLFGCLFALATVTWRANQILCGLALTLIGTGLAATVGKAYSGTPSPAVFGRVEIPLLVDIPVIGRAFFAQNVLVYLIFIILPVGLHLLMFRTRHGLNLRAVGENPAAADAAGIAVQRIRFWYVAAGAALAAGAGAYLTLAFVPSWSEGVVAGRGWIAVALVIFAGYRPLNAVLAALLFGVITALGFVGQARNWPIAPAFLSMLPYLGTIGFIIVPVIAWHRMRQWMAAPAALGEPYFRDVR
ncbi:ABC transporter permease [Prosthecomicrobium pneumaticum]|uniref:Simple sugar transport system permease protein n=1 Tax=Prosthecomicrobium pneumaticum TaxID=81895 RepID=A0A7W9L3Q8_9HYPH|nr:ABC transporter permease [Prosthecomicrobium pneumaticum]MBB5754793.1 simple sugar transport system permease protein [Prosthecomicrobium pneumaticum]